MKSIIAAVMVMTAGFAWAGNYPVAKTTQLPTGTLTNAGTLLEQAPPMPQGQSAALTLAKGEQTKQVATCDAYLAMTHMGYSPANNAEQATASFYVDYCVPIYQLSQAKPAKISNIRDFDLWNGYQWLPAKIVMPNLSGHGPKGTFISAFPKAKVSYLRPTEIQVSDLNQVANIKVLGWGDVTGDGVDDMLLAINHYVVGGSYRAYDVVWVTRTTPDSVIKVVQPRNTST